MGLFIIEHFLLPWSVFHLNHQILTTSPHTHFCHHQSLSVCDIKKTWWLCEPLWWKSLCCSWCCFALQSLGALPHAEIRVGWRCTHSLPEWFCGCLCLMELWVCQGRVSCAHPWRCQRWARLEVTPDGAWSWGQYLCRRVCWTMRHLWCPIRKFSWQSLSAYKFGCMNNMNNWFSKLANRTDSLFGLTCL